MRLLEPGDLRSSNKLTACESGMLPFSMDPGAVITALRVREPELQAAGVVRLAVFGSVACGDSGEDSNVYVVVPLSEEAGQGGYAYFGRLATLRSRLTSILGQPVDVVAEPIRKERLRQAIEKERAIAF